MALSPSLDDFVARETYFDLMLVDTLLCSFDYAPDTLIKVARESSCNNGPAFIAAIMLEHECTVAFSHPYQSNVSDPSNPTLRHSRRSRMLRPVISDTERTCKRDWNS